MTSEEFIKEIETQIAADKQAFIDNMHHLGIETKTFCEWIKIFSAWMEWNSDDCEQFHQEKV